MNLILSVDFDFSVNEVIAWLGYYKSAVKRINDSDDLELFSVEIGEVKQILYNGVPVKSIWFRNKPRVPGRASVSESEHDATDAAIAKHLEREIPAVYTSFGFGSNKVLGEPQLTDPNKTSVLNAALRCGLKVPETIITNSRSSLMAFAEKFSGIIVKPLTNIFLHRAGKQLLMQYTELISKEEIAQAPEFFFPTLAQECIEKQFEIRIFYLDKDIYCMAIFSQQTGDAKIDFRKSYNLGSIRKVPFSLPESVREKITDLMITLQQNIGVIDMIYSTNGEYYFLEVNPVGQYEDMSEVCNFYLNRRIADWLIQCNGR